MNNIEKPIITEKELDDIFLMISENVKYFRNYNHSKYADENGKISQSRLAEMCEISQSLIANLESVKVHQPVSITVLATISKALEIPFEELFKMHDFNRSNGK